MKNFLKLGVLVLSFIFFSGVAYAANVTFSAATTVAFTAGNCTVVSGSTASSVTLSGNALTVALDGEFALTCGVGVSVTPDVNISSNVCSDRTQVATARGTSSTVVFTAAANDCVPVGSSQSQSGRTQSSGGGSPSVGTPASSVAVEESAVGSTQSIELVEIINQAPGVVVKRVEKKKKKLSLRERLRALITDKSSDDSSSGATVVRKVAQNTSDRVDMLKKRRMLLERKKSAAQTAESKQTVQLSSTKSSSSRDIFLKRRLLLQKKKEREQQKREPKTGVSSSVNDNSDYDMSPSDTQNSVDGKSNIDVVPNRILEALQRLKKK